MVKKEKSMKERKGWSVTIHDLSGSPVATASMVTPFVPSPGTDRVNRSNPGAWLILRPSQGTWKPWGRLEAWREKANGDHLGYRFEVLPDSATGGIDAVTLEDSIISTKKGGKFTIDISREAINVVEKTELHNIICAPLTLRFPLNILLGNIMKNNVCVVDDAFHPMTPEVGEGGSSALKDSVVLARCLAEAFLCKGKRENFKEEKEEFKRIKRAMKKYGKVRRWRSFSLITISYLVGLIQQSDCKVLSFLREKWLARYTSVITLRVANFDFGSLLDSS